MTVFVVCKHEPNHVVCTVMFRTNTCTVTPLLWMCLGVSGTKILAADPLSPTGCEVEHLCIGFVGPAHPIDAQSDWNLGNLETMKQTPWTLSCSSDNFWNIFAVFCPNERGHCYQRTPLCHEGGGMWFTTIFRSMVHVKDPHASTQGFPAEHWPDHNTAFVILLPPLPQVNDVHAPTIHLI